MILVDRACATAHTSVRRPGTVGRVGCKKLET
jgi:hypothetical protein